MPSAPTSAFQGRLFIVGNDAFILNAMRHALRSSSAVNLFGVIDGRHSVRAAIREAQPDIVVVDGLSDAQAGVERLREIREETPHALVLLLSAPLDQSALDQVLEAGAMACVAAVSLPAHTAPTPIPAPQTAAPPTPATNWHVTDNAAAAEATTPPTPEPCPLTPRELEILHAVAQVPSPPSSPRSSRRHDSPVIR